MKMQYWLVKSDPETYSWEKMKKDKRTFWDGVRNYQARNYLKEMKIGDLVLFYHSQSDKAIVGITKVVKEYYQDPTTDDERWVVVDLEYYEDFQKPVTLDQIKDNPTLANLPLVKQQRLSVMPITEAQFNEIIRLSK